MTEIPKNAFIVFDGRKYDIIDIGVSQLETQMHLECINTGFFKIIPPITFSVIFNGNGGIPETQTLTGIIPETSIFENENLEIPTVTRTGFNFIEWNTLEDGNGNTFDENTNVNEDNLQVYAIWEQITFKIFDNTFDNTFE